LHWLVSVRIYFCSNTLLGSCIALVGNSAYIFLLKHYAGILDCTGWYSADIIMSKHFSGILDCTGWYQCGYISVQTLCWDPGLMHWLVSMRINVFMFRHFAGLWIIALVGNNADIFLFKFFSGILDYCTGLRSWIIALV
jgi:hypothetical protein